MESEDGNSNSSKCDAVAARSDTQMWLVRVGNSHLMCSFEDLFGGRPCDSVRMKCRHCPSQKKVVEGSTFLVSLLFPSSACKNPSQEGHLVAQLEDARRKSFSPRKVL